MYHTVSYVQLYAYKNYMEFFNPLKTQYRYSKIQTNLFYFWTFLSLLAFYNSAYVAALLININPSEI